MPLRPRPRNGRSLRSPRPCRGRSSPRCRRGEYDEAATAFDRLIAEAKTPSDRSYYRFLRGIAERLGGKAEDARRTLTEALEAEPKGPWAAKIRFELAAVELAAGRAPQAEALARAEAETLLAADRKDRLAEVYHAFARRLLAPDDPVSQPDPNGAYVLLVKARELAKGETLRASLLFAMGRAGQKPGRLEGRRHPQANAIRDFQAYLKEYPKGRRPLRRPVPPGRGPARRRPERRRPDDLDRPCP